MPSHPKSLADDTFRVQVAYRRLDEIKPNPKNPRRHSRRQIRALVRNIKVHGFVVPVLVDAFGNLICGHARVEAARIAGLTQVPAICIDHLTPAQVQALTLAENRISELGSWDENLLAESLKELSLLGVDFDIETTAFSIGEVDVKIETIEPAPDDSADVALPPANLPPVSQLGDLWFLRDHRVLCGNALEDGAFAILMDGRKANVVFVDQPYNCPIEGHVSGLGAIHHREFAFASGEMSSEQYSAFLHRSLGLLASNSVDGSIHFACMNWRGIALLVTVAQGVYTELKTICTWVKPHPALGSFYRNQSEFVAVFKMGTAPHTNNIRLGEFGRNRSTIWEYPSPSAFARKFDEGSLLELHPTPKVPRMVADAILDCSARGELVLDSFLGSGTTLIAAERVGRVCYGMEIDPLYVDTAVRRWQIYAGEQARHAVTGKTFDEVAQERSDANV